MRVRAFRVCELVSTDWRRLGSNLILDTVLDFFFDTSCFVVGKFLMADFVAEEDKLFIDATASLATTAQVLMVAIHLLTTGEA